MEIVFRDDVLVSGPPERAASSDLVQCDRCDRLIARTTCLTFDGADYVYHFCGAGCCSAHDANQGGGRTGGSTRGVDPPALPDVEAGRMAFLMMRDGELAARQWAERTLAVYRRAVLHRDHFASTPEYRRKFILSYLSFRRWLSGGVRRRTPT